MFLSSSIKTGCYPILAQWDITQGCNFRCKFCLSSSSEKQETELSSTDAIKMIGQLYKDGVIFLRILGGEPFYRKDFIEILEYSANIGMFLSFSTNASMITSETAGRLKNIENAIPYMQVSIYGYDQTSYYNTTGNPDSFLLTKKGIGNLVDHNIQYSALFVATSYNYKNIEYYYNFAKEMRAKEFRIVQAIKLGRALTMNVKEDNYLSHVLNIANEINIRKKTNDPEILIQARPLLGTRVYKRYGIKTFHLPCEATKKMIYIDAMGMCYPCPFIKNLPGHIKNKYNDMLEPISIDQGIAEIWESEYFSSFRSLFDPEKSRYKINTRCEYYNRDCTPCAITPCECLSQIQEII